MAGASERGVAGLVNMTVVVVGFVQEGQQLV